MKAIFWLPTMFVDLLRVWLLPRWLFLATYKSQSEQLREAEQQVRNATRLVEYYTKKALIVEDK